MTSWPTTLATSVRQVPPAIARFHAPSSRSCARGAPRSNASAQRPAAPARPPVGQSLAAASRMQARVSLTFAQACDVRMTIPFTPDQLEVHRGRPHGAPLAHEMHRLHVQGG